MAVTNVEFETKRINLFGDYEDVTNMSVEDWKNRWGQEQTQFHRPVVHPMLQKHLDSLTLGRDKLKIFVPLCGKSLDIKWLLEQGLEVIGCEGVDRGCQEFFQEHDIPYTCDSMSSCEGTVYKATDRPLTLYRCDFFDLTREEVGQFDCIWDRGSFVAVPITKRERYVEVIVPLMTDNCKYLLNCVLVDNAKFGGPPFNCEENEAKKYFQPTCTMEKIDTRDALAKWQKNWGITYCFEEIYMLELK